MALSSIQICNEALGMIGVDTITSFSDSSKQARLCAMVFQDCLDSVLEAHDWACARARATLTADSVAPLFQWGYRYFLPASPYCLKLVSVQSVEDSGESNLIIWPNSKAKIVGIPYELEGRYILCDEEDGINIRYIKRVISFTEMPSELVQAVAAKIARRLLPSFTWTAARKAAIDQDYATSIRQAKFNGAVQDYSTDEKENSAAYGGNSEWVEGGR
jgi:hypothetical protein